MNTIPSQPMAPLHLLLAIAVVTVWGFNFIMIQIGLTHIPPLTLCVMRFLLTSIPAIFLIKKPQVPWHLIFLYGFFIFALQFSFLFIGMKIGVSPGIAALILQLQVFFAIFLAFIFLGQKLTFWQILGALVSLSGIVEIALHTGGECSLIGFFFILGAGLSWGIGNVITIKLAQVNMLSLVIWGSFMATFPLLLMALLLEGPSTMIHSLQTLTWPAIIAIIYISFGSTHFGYGGWSWLLTKYPMASIAPFALIAPIIAIISSAIIFAEPLQIWKLSAASMVILGICINLYGKRWLNLLFANGFSLFMEG